MKRLLIVVALFVCVMFDSHASQAQEPWDYLQTTGFPNFSTTVPVEFGSVNLANGNLHLEIPLSDYNQRGVLKFNPRFVYDSRMWIPVLVGSQWVWNPVQGIEDPTWSYPSAHGTWALMTDYYDLTGQLRSNPSQNGNGLPISWASWTVVSCSGVSYRVFQNFEFTVGENALSFDIKISQNSCTGYPTSADGFSTDGAGYHLYVQADSSTGLWDTEVVAPDGTDLWHVRDSNGNYFSASPNSEFPLEDTLGRQLVTVSGTPQNGSFPVYYDVLNSEGGTSRYTVNYSTINVATHFNQSGIQDVSGTAGVVTSIVLPDNSSYQFQYDSYGVLSNMTLPTGATITYGYTNFADGFGNVNRWLTSKTSGGSTWNYLPQVTGGYCSPGASSGCYQQNMVVQPSGDYVLYTYTMNGAPWLTGVIASNQSNATLYSRSSTYDFSNSCSSCFGGIGYVHESNRVESVPGANGTMLNKQTEFDYNPGFAYNDPYAGAVTAIKEWNFYTGSPGATPDRETDIEYSISNIRLFATNGGPTFVYSTPIDKLSLVQVLTSGSITAQTEYTYDNTTLSSISGVSNHDDGDYGTGNTSRGNVTIAGRWVSGGYPNRVWSNVSYIYDTTGQVVTSTDQANNSIYYNYHDNFINGASLCAGVTNAYIGFITYPLIGAEQYDYDCGTGQPMRYIDENNAQINVTYNDTFSRPTLLADPIGGWLLNVYTSPSQVDSYLGITDSSRSSSCTACRHDELVLDTLGRTSNQITVNDPDGQINRVTSYDNDGRAYSMTNPYHTTSDPTYGTTIDAFDGLNRITKITDQDGSVVNIAIGQNAGNVAQSCSTGLGYPVLTTDEAGKERLSWIDGFGRAVEVDEPTSSGSLSIATCYQYDGGNNLLSVTQMGDTTNSSQWRTRTFVYDGLSRVTSATEPETGTTTYYYTTASGPLCAGDPSLVCRRTDGRGITTTYTYDALNRLTSKTYSDSTPTVAYYYDQGSYNGLTITNGIGRRTGMLDGTGQTAWSYDASGHVLTKRQTINGVTESISYTYNLDGSIATLSSPNGRVYTYGYNNSQRAVSLSDNGNGITYAQNVHYAAPGLLTSGQHGKNLAISESNSFNNRLEPTLLSASGSGQTLLSLGYNWVLPGGGNDGSVYQIQNNRDSSNNRSFQYSYDSLNRLQAAGTFSGVSSPWTTTYSYDNWGNLLQKWTSGSGGDPNMGPITADVHNHVNPSNYSYDGAGNLTWDGINALKYDAENRVNPTSGPYTYSYDGEDHRAEKNNAGSITYYWYDDNFDVISTTGSLVRDYVYFNGQSLASLSFSNNVPYYYWLDHLGNTRTMSTPDGASVQWEADYYPFGGPNILNNYLTNKFRFSEYEWDSELGDNYADYREESPVLGRFFSPDPLPGNVTNPQSWNRYNFVLNRPTSMTDPVGLQEGGFSLCIWCDIGLAVGDLLDLLFGGGGAHPPIHLNGPPPGKSGAGQDSGPLAGETLGLPNQVRLPQPSIAGIVLPSDAICEFGPCVSIGNGIAQTLPLSTIGVLGEGACIIFEPCGAGAAIFIGTFTVVTAGIDAYRHFSKADKPDPQSGPGTQKDRSLQGTQDQLNDMERAQKDQEKTKNPIDSIEKSKQNLKDKLKGIKSLKDVEEK